MAEVLSQNEIDALLNNMGGQEEPKDVPQEINKSGKEVIPFDFRLPNRISKNQLRTIRNIYENFAELFGSYLMSKLQSIININVLTVDQIYYSEYVLSVSNPACLFTFDIKKTDIKGILEFSNEFAFTLIDRLLGGNGTGSKSSNVITVIEQRVLQTIVEKIMQDLEKAWQIIGDYEFVIDKFEPDVDFVQITSQSESVLLITFEILIGEQAYLMNLCFATYAFDTILSKLSTQNLSSIRPIKHDGTTSKSILTQKLMDTELLVEVEFGRSSISFQQLMQLKVGDVISLDKKIGEEVLIKIDNKELYYGIPGKSNKHKSVKITRRAFQEE